MKRTIIVLLAALLVLTAVSAALADDKPLFIAINKSADQNYFIDLQTNFMQLETSPERDI